MKPFEEYQKATLEADEPENKTVPQPPKIPSSELENPYGGSGIDWERVLLWAFALALVGYLIFLTNEEHKETPKPQKEVVEKVIYKKTKPSVRYKTKWKTKWKTQTKTKYVESPRLIHENRVLKENLATARERIKRLTHQGSCKISKYYHITR